MNDRRPYLQSLAAVEKAAAGSPLRRLAFAPGRYLRGMVHSKLLYRLNGRSLRRQAPLFFGGTMEVLLPAGLDIYLLGAKTHESEIRLARFMIRQLETGMAMLDTGAHFGFFSRLGAALVGESGKVLAIEAAGNTFEVLGRNTSGQPAIEAIRAAASDTAGSVTFYEFPALYSEYNTLAQGQFEGASWRKGITPRVVTVSAYPLDQLIGEWNRSVQFIKIDVEGAEAQVVAGLEGWLQSPGARWLAMEYLAEERHNDSHRRASRLLASMGWAPYAIQPDGSLKGCADIELHLKDRGLDSDNIVFQPQ